MRVRLPEILRRSGCDAMVPARDVWVGGTSQSETIGDPSTPVSRGFERCQNAHKNAWCMQAPKSVELSHLAPPNEADA
eukprot:356411-Chlamydomonas_euryale.AAC.8